jgi:hypothetical protein
MRLWESVVVATVAVAIGSLVLGAGTAPRYDLLIVIDGSGQKEVARALHATLELRRAASHKSVDDLPIDQYDLQNPGQAESVRRLGIRPEQLPFLGVATLSPSGDRPDHVVVGLGPITLPVTGAVDELLAQVRDNLGWDLASESGSEPSATPAVALPTVESVVMVPSAMAKEPTHTYGPRDDFFCSVHVTSIQIGARLTARWYRGDTLLDTHDFESSMQGDGRVRYTLTTPAVGWQPGEYRVDISAGDQVLGTAAFNVESR